MHSELPRQVVALGVDGDELELGLADRRLGQSLLHQVCRLQENTGGHVTKDTAAFAVEDEYVGRRAQDGSLELVSRQIAQTETLSLVAVSANKKNTIITVTVSTKTN